MTKEIKYDNRRTQRQRTSNEKSPPTHTKILNIHDILLIITSCVYISGLHVLIKTVNDHSTQLYSSVEWSFAVLINCGTQPAKFHKSITSSCMMRHSVFDRCVPIFRRDLLPPSSRYKTKDVGS